MMKNLDHDEVCWLEVGDAHSVVEKKHQNADDDDIDDSLLMVFQEQDMFFGDVHLLVL